MDAPRLTRAEGYWLGQFHAMASPCQVLMAVPDKQTARRMLDAAQREALRIETKFSRYRTNNIVYRINRSAGTPVQVDDETAQLLDYAGQCHALSEGLFDITSGVLRKVWSFDGSDRLPSTAQIDAVRNLVGWHKVDWRRPYIALPAGMEIDLGGIGKEYAVDRVANLLRGQTTAGIVVNFGGDIAVTGPRADNSPWVIGIDAPDATGQQSVGEIHLSRGAVATSGDARRFLLKDGIRYGHILDPRTGAPVQGAPHAVTVLADTCLEAGILATLAILHGPQAREFLNAQAVTYWCAE